MLKGEGIAKDYSACISFRFSTVLLFFRGRAVVRVLKAAMRTFVERGEEN